MIGKDKEAHYQKQDKPMHTTEHILNQTMIRLFGCARSKNAHIEKKKSKCDYFLKARPSEKEIADIEKKVNEIIELKLAVSAEIISRDEAAKIVDLSKLPEDAPDTLRIVRVGDYDVCACIGNHVENTSQIGAFKIISYDYDEMANRLRLRFKLNSREE